MEVPLLLLDSHNDRESSSGLWRSLSVFFGIFFFLSAFVQWNDPDPILWIIAYGVPCMLSFWFSFHGQSIRIFNMVALLHIMYTLGLGLWTLYQWLAVQKHVHSIADEEMFLEESKELIGLCLSSLWSFLLHEKRCYKLQRIGIFLASILCFLPFLTWFFLDTIEEKLKKAVVC